MVVNDGPVVAVGDGSEALSSGGEASGDAPMRQEAGLALGAATSPMHGWRTTAPSPLGIAPQRRFNKK